MSESSPVSPSPAAPPERKSRVPLFTAFLRCNGTMTFRDFIALSREDVNDFLEAAAKVEGERAGLLAEAIVRASAPPQPDPLEKAGRQALAILGGRPA